MAHAKKRNGILLEILILFYNFVPKHLSDYYNYVGKDKGQDGFLLA
jgi:hypothetical protein